VWDKVQGTAGTASRSKPEIKIIEAEFGDVLFSMINMPDS
jgi:hypothetical protein